MKNQKIELKNIKLPVRIMHEHLDAKERIDSLDSRIDTLDISILVSYQSKVLIGDHSLDGLYNYAGLIHSLDKLQGMEITGPVEKINDLISEMLEKDALDAGLILHKTEVRIERTGSARITPVFILEKFY